MNRITMTILLLVSLSTLGGWECGEPLTDDSGFDLWCGDALCAWKVDSGAIKRVPTWHRSDYGAELVGDPVVLSQVSKATSKDVNCFQFDLITDQDDKVDITIEMDFLADGTIEYSHPVASDDWVPARYRITPPTWFDKVRFIIRKQGPGRAVLTQIKVSKGADCTDKPIDLKDRPNGVKCSAAADCKSGFCAPVQQWRSDIGDAMVSVCSACRGGTDCTSQDICGVETDANYLYLGCGAPKRRPFAHRCLADAECSTGYCCQGICSQCCAGKGCSANTTCQLLDYNSLGEDYSAQILPWQCSPLQGQGSAGEVCLSDKDCASGKCAGTGQLKQCFLDGRQCKADTDCPLWNACFPMGIAGGLCQ